MKKLLSPCLSFFCILLSLLTPAQKNYQSGYIVQAHQDTVRGRIDSRDWVTNPRQISFQDTLTGKVTLYGPEQLTAFFVNGEAYRSFTVRIYPYSQDAAVISGESAPANPYDSLVFLRLVTGGKLNLYYYKDRSDITYYFIQKQAAGPEQLRIRNLVIEKDGISSVVKDDLYKYQLADWVGDCAATAERPVRVDYSEKALRKLIFTYNNCGKDTLDRAATARQGKVIRLTPLLGYFQSTLRVSGDQDIAKMSWPNYSGLTGGVGMLITLPRGREQFSFFTDLLYRHYSSRSSVYLNAGELEEQGLLDYSQLQLDIQFRYRFPSGTVRPFFNFGFSNALLINNKSNLFEHDNITNQNNNDPIFGVTGGTRSFQLGLIGGAGISAGRFSLEARIERSESLSQAVSTSATQTNLYLLAAFSF